MYVKRLNYLVSIYLNGGGRIAFDDEGNIFRYDENDVVQGTTDMSPDQLEEFAAYLNSCAARIRLADSDGA